MKPETYFKKYGCIYGVSMKYSFGKWSGYTRRFTDLVKAKEWLNTEERDFRIRELTSETRADAYERIFLT